MEIQTIRRGLPALGMLLVTMGLAPAGQTANLTREAELAAEVTTRLAPGDEVVWLAVAGRRVLGLARRADGGAPRGAVLLLTGRDQHPASSAPLGALRRRLANRGWDTLTVQMPLLSLAAPLSQWLTLDAEALPRIAAGIAHLKQQQPDRIALLGFDSGANQALRFAADAAARDLDALVLISPVPPAADRPAAAGPTGRPARERLPVLLITAGADSRATLAFASRLAVQLRGTELTERRIPGARHDFEGQETLLGSTVRAWLHRATR